MNEKATLAAGCFWCIEAIFKRLKGVSSVTSGYAGGHMKNPSYEEMFTHNTGHAESVQIEYNPRELSYEKILDFFFAFHDPTTKDRQGSDTGPMYRSIIFYHSDEQKHTAEEKIRELTREEKFKDPIITEIRPFTNFYKAEDYHQDYYQKNPAVPYCMFVIDPKIRKLLDTYQAYLKP